MGIGNIKPAISPRAVKIDQTRCSARPVGPPTRAARMPGDGASDMAINGAIAMIAARAPTDEIEAALALQMACTHMAALAVMSRVGGAVGRPQRLPGLASASAKLLRAFCTQVAALSAADGRARRDEGAEANGWFDVAA